MDINKLKTADLRKMAEKQEIEGWEDMEKENLLKALQPGEEPETSEEEPEDISELSIKELKKIAKEQGVDIKGLRSKKDIAEAIWKIGKKGNKPLAEGGIDQDDKGPEEEASPETEGIEGGRAPMGSKAAIMKAKLAKQPKVTILIPLGKGEKLGTTTPVILDGYRLNIRHGAYVPVPEQVARIIMKSQKQTIAALRGKTINPQSGQEKDSVLDGSEKELG